MSELEYEYRIVTDFPCGFKVERRIVNVPWYQRLVLEISRDFFPFDSADTLEEAQKLCEEDKARKKFKPEVVG